MQNSYDIGIDFNERTGALGMTGYGKTFLMQWLVNQFEGISVIIVDTKRSIRIPGFNVTSDEKIALSSGKTIYRPKNRTKPEENFWYKVWGRFGAKRKKDAHVYIDEMGHVTSPARVPEGLELIIQAGREMGIGVSWAAQRPNNMSNTVLSQTDKLFVFRQPNERDRQKIADTFGATAHGAGELERYQFHAYGFPEVEGLQSSEGTETYILEYE